MEKMFVDTRINACTHKTIQTCNFSPHFPFQEDCLLFFALFSYSLLFLKFEGGGGMCNPRNPPSRSANDVYCIDNNACVVLYNVLQVVPIKEIN